MRRLYADWVDSVTGETGESWFDADAARVIRAPNVGNELLYITAGGKFVWSFLSVANGEVTCDFISADAAMNWLRDVGLTPSVIDPKFGKES